MNKKTDGLDVERTTSDDMAMRQLDAMMAHVNPRKAAAAEAALQKWALEQGVNGPELLVTMARVAAKTLYYMPRCEHQEQAIHEAGHLMLCEAFVLLEEVVAAGVIPTRAAYHATLDAKDAEARAKEKQGAAIRSGEIRLGTRH